jgi:hypothetical protein
MVDSNYLSNEIKQANKEVDKITASINKEFNDKYAKFTIAFDVYKNSKKATREAINIEQKKTLQQKDKELAEDLIKKAEELQGFKHITKGEELQGFNQTKTTIAKNLKDLKIDFEALSLRDQNSEQNLNNKANTLNQPQNLNVEVNNQNPEGMNPQQNNNQNLQNQNLQQERQNNNLDQRETVESFEIDSSNVKQQKSTKVPKQSSFDNFKESCKSIKDRFLKLFKAKEKKEEKPVLNKDQKTPSQTKTKEKKQQEKNTLSNKPKYQNIELQNFKLSRVPDLTEELNQKLGQLKKNSQLKQPTQNNINNPDAQTNQQKEPVNQTQQQGQKNQGQPVQQENNRGQQPQQNNQQPQQQQNNTSKKVSFDGKIPQDSVDTLTKIQAQVDSLQKNLTDLGKEVDFEKNYPEKTNKQQNLEDIKPNVAQPNQSKTIAQRIQKFFNSPKNESMRNAEKRQKEMEEALKKQNLKDQKEIDNIKKNPIKSRVLGQYPSQKQQPVEQNLQNPNLMQQTGGQQQKPTNPLDLKKLNEQSEKNKKNLTALEKEWERIKDMPNLQQQQPNVQKQQQGQKGQKAQQQGQQQMPEPQQQPQGNGQGQPQNQQPVNQTQQQNQELQKQQVPEPQQVPQQPQVQNQQNQQKQQQVQPQVQNQQKQQQGQKVPQQQEEQTQQQNQVQNQVQQQVQQQVQPQVQNQQPQVQQTQKQVQEEPKVVQQRGGDGVSNDDQILQKIKDFNTAQGEQIKSLVLTLGCEDLFKKLDLEKANIHEIAKNEEVMKLMDDISKGNDIKTASKEVQEIVKEELGKIRGESQEFYKKLHKDHKFEPVKWEDNVNGNGTKTVSFKVGGEKPLVLTEKTETIQYEGENVTFRNVNLPLKLEEKPNEPVTLSFAAFTVPKGERIDEDKAEYVTVHYDKEGRLTGMSMPQPIKFLGTDEKSPIMFQGKDGKEYTLGINRGQYKAMTEKIAKNKTQTQELNKVEAKDFAVGSHDNKLQTQQIKTEQKNEASKIQNAFTDNSNKLKENTKQKETEQQITKKSNAEQKDQPNIKYNTDKTKEIIKAIGANPNLSSHNGNFSPSSTALNPQQESQGQSKQQR